MLNTSNICTNNFIYQSFSVQYNTCQRKLNNPYFPLQLSVDSKEAFKKAVGYDNTPYRFTNGYRKKSNFVDTDCIIVDIDNDSSKCPELWDCETEWLDWEGLCRMLPDVEIWAATSRSHMKHKGERKPRPKLHVYFPLGGKKGQEETELMLKAICSKLVRKDGEKWFDPAVCNVSNWLAGDDDKQVFHQKGHTMDQLGWVRQFKECKKALNPVPGADTKQELRPVEEARYEKILEELRRIGCLWRNNHQTANLFHEHEKTKGGWYLYFNAPQIIHHQSQGSMGTLEWLDRHYPGHQASESSPYFAPRAKKESGPVRNALEEFRDKSLLVTESQEQFHLKENEYLKKLLDDKSLEFKNNRITVLEGHTGIGKGSIATYFHESDNGLLLCVAPLRRLVSQTYERLKEDVQAGGVAHYESSSLAQANKAKALAICDLSVRPDKQVLDCFINGKGDGEQVTVILDEVHLVAKNLFRATGGRSRYRDFVDALSGKVSRIVAMSATLSAAAKEFIHCLGHDLSLKIDVVEVTKDKKPLLADVSTYKTKKQKLSYLEKVVDDVTARGGKLVYVDQSRKYIEAHALPYFKELHPRLKYNVVTARTDEEYDTDEAVVTIGSPSLATGMSLDTAVDTLVVALNENVAELECFTQIFNRVRRDNGLNEDTQVIVLCRQRNTTGSKDTLRFLLQRHRKKMLSKLAEANRILKGIDNPFNSNTFDSLKSKAGEFLFHDGQQWAYSDAYLNMECMKAAERRLIQQQGILEFMHFFKLNPDYLQGVLIQRISKLDAKVVAKDEQKMEMVEKKTKEEELNKILNTKQIGSYKEKLELLGRKESGFGSMNAEQMEDIDCKLALFDASVAGIKDAEKHTLSRIKAKTTKRKPIAVINSFLTLMQKEKLDSMDARKRLFQRFSAGRENEPLLFELAWAVGQIYKLWQDGESCNTALLAKMIENKLQGFSAFKDVFGRGEQTRTKVLGKIMNLFGYRRKRTPQRDRTCKISWVQSNNFCCLSLRSGYCYQTLWLALGDGLAWEAVQEAGGGAQAVEKLIDRLHHIRGITSN